MMDVEYLRSILSYDPDTGEFRRLVARPGYRAGSIAGSIDAYGYIAIKIDGRSYKAHRLAWLYVHGAWPALHLDHIDEDKANNKITNLREATHQQNRCNRGAQKNNTSGYKGVWWHKGHGKWCSRVQVSRRTVWSGSFSCPKEAHRAYTEAARRHYGEFANGAHT